MKRAVLLATIAVGVGALAGCGSSGSTGSSNGSSSSIPSGPINILAVADMTGPTKALGQPSASAMKAAVAYYNAHGGVAGHKLKLTVVDYAGSTATATSELVKQLTTHRGKYAMVYAGTEASAVAATDPILAKYGQFSVSLDDPANACRSAGKCPYQFSEYSYPTISMPSFAAWAKQRHITHVGVLEQAIAYPQSEMPGLTSALKQAGIRYTVAGFGEDVLDLTPQMSKLKAAGAQAVFTLALGPAVGDAAKDRAKLGWNVPIVADSVGAGSDLTTLAPASQLHQVYEQVATCADPKRHIPAFADYTRYGGTFGTSLCNVGGTGWDAIVMLAKAVSQAHSTSSAALAKAMPKVAATDPAYVDLQRHRYSASVRDNLDNTAADWTILPVRPIVDGRLASSRGG